MVCVLGICWFGTAQRWTALRDGCISYQSFICLKVDTPIKLWLGLLHGARVLHAFFPAAFLSFQCGLEMWKELRLFAHAIHGGLMRHPFKVVTSCYKWTHFGNLSVESLQFVSRPQHVHSSAMFHFSSQQLFLQFFIIYTEFVSGGKNVATWFSPLKL